MILRAIDILKNQQLTYELQLEDGSYSWILHRSELPEISELGKNTLDLCTRSINSFREKQAKINFMECEHLSNQMFINLNI